jgi:hypothetical protein
MITGKDLEGTGSDLVEAISEHFIGRTKEYH